MPCDFADFRAPWEIYPEIPCGSIHWRMGSGEDVMHEWWSRFRALTHEQRLTYHQMHLGSEAWSKWLDQVIEDLPKQADKAEIARLLPLELNEVLISYNFETPHSVEVRTMKMPGVPPGGRIFKLTRTGKGWELLEALTQSWKA